MIIKKSLGNSKFLFKIQYPKYLLIKITESSIKNQQLLIDRENGKDLKDFHKLVEA